MYSYTNKNMKTSYSVVYKTQKLTFFNEVKHLNVRVKFTYAGLMFSLYM